MGKFRNRFKRGMAVFMAIATTLTTANLDVASLTVYAAGETSFRSGSKIMLTQEIGNSNPYSRVDGVKFKISVPNNTTTTVSYKVDVYDMTGKTGTVGGTSLGSMTNSVTYINGTLKSSSYIKEDIVNAAEDEPVILNNAAEDIEAFEETVNADILPVENTVDFPDSEPEQTEDNSAVPTEVIDNPVITPEVPEENPEDNTEDSATEDSATEEQEEDTEEIIEEEIIDTPLVLDPGDFETKEITATGISWSKSGNAIFAAGAKVGIVISFTSDVTLPTGGSGGEIYYESGDFSFAYVDASLMTSAASEPDDVTAISIDPTNHLYFDITDNNATQSFTATITPAQRVINWSVTGAGAPTPSNSTGASTSATFATAGDYVVKASNTSGSKNATVDVTAFTATLSDTSFEYDGTDKKPAVVVNPSNTVTPVYDTDSKSAGIHNVRFTVGSGDGAADVVRQYTITRKDIAGITFDNSKFSVNLTNNIATYTGEETIDITATNKRYSSGTYLYDLVLEGTGNYTGTQTITGIVGGSTGAKVPLSAVITAEIDNSQPYIYDFNNDVEATVIYKDLNGNIVDFSGNVNLSYDNCKNVGEDTASVTIAAKAESDYTGSIVLNYSIDPFDIGASYSRGEISVEFIEPTPAGTTAGGATAYTHTGTAITPRLKIKKGSNVLSAGTDYELSYTNNINIGNNARISVDTAGINRCNFCGDFAVTYSIVADITKDARVQVEGKRYPVSNGQASADSITYTYNGSEQKPSAAGVRVYIGSTDLGAANYTVDFNEADYTSAGTKKFTITGNGLYAGQVIEVSYVILPYNLSSTAVSVSPSSFVYNGTEQKPADGDYVVKNPVGAGNLTLGTDYTVSTVTPDLVQAGNKQVQIVGTGNFNGTKLVNYEITMLNIANSSVTVKPIADQLYTGAEIKPEIVLVYNGTEFTTGFTTIFNNNVKKGIGEFTITGDGRNLTGKKTGSFNIVAKSLEDLDYYVDNVKCQGSGSTYVSDYSPVYDGTGKPLSRLKIKDPSIPGGEKTLELNTDYTVTPPTQTPVDAGSYTYTIVGVGNYQGSSVTVTYSVAKANIDPSESGVRFILSQDGYEDRAGKAYPKVVLKDTLNRNRQLQEGTDYTIAVDVEGTDASVAGLNKKARITGIGNYSGERVVTYDVGYNIEDCTITIQQQNGAVGGIPRVPYIGANDPTFVITAPDGTVFNTAASYEVTDFDTAKPDHYNSYNATNEITATIKGKGVSLFGEKDITYLIIPGHLNTDVAISGPELVNNKISKQYNGNSYQIKDLITLNYLYGDINIDTDVSINPEVIGPDVSSGTVTINGTGGNFRESLSFTYEIAKRDIGAAGISIDGIVSKTYTGSALGQDISIRDNGKLLQVGADYTVHYANNVEPGQATITITGAGNYTGTVTRTFDINAISLRDALTSGLLTKSATPDQIYDGSPKQPPVTIFYDGVALSPTSDIDITYVDDVIPGQATIKVTAKSGNGKYKEGAGFSAEFHYNIVANISDKAIFTVQGAEDQSYDLINLASGSPYTPPSNIAVSYADGILTSGAGGDIMVSTTGMDVPGTGYIVVSGKAPYATGQQRIPVKVYVALSSCSIVGIDATGYPYTGAEIKPTPIVTYADKTVSPSLYNVSYSNNINAGDQTATVTITPTDTQHLTGGVQDKSFTIYYDLAAAYQRDVNTEYPYTGSAIEPVPRLFATPTEDHQIPTNTYSVSYTNNTNVGNATITISPAAGTKICKGTKTINFKIAGISILPGTLSLRNPADAASAYTGSAISPDVNLIVGGKTLVKDKDYTVSYRNNVNASTPANKAVITVTGINNYTGEKDIEFEITPVDISMAVISPTTLTTTYAGRNVKVKPDYTLTYNGAIISEGTDYDVNIGTSQSVGAGNGITFKGLGNFKGTRNESFTIERADISLYYMTTSDDSKEYTGAEMEPTITITCSLGGTDYKLVKGTDYTIDYVRGVASGKPRDVGEYQITVSGIGGFTGTLNNQTFTITPADLSATDSGVNGRDRYTVTLDRTEFPIVAGVTEYKPVPTVIDEVRHVTLVQGQDYDVTYVNNTHSGCTEDENGPTVIVSGLDNYTGERRVGFNIGTSIALADVSPSANSRYYVTPNYTYNGRSQVPAGASVMLNGVALVEGVDYEVVPQDPSITTNASDNVPYVIKGIGAYYGRATGYYVIAPKIVEQDDINFILDYQKDSTGKYYILYEGAKDYEPAVTIYDRQINNRVALIEGQDYVIDRYVNNRNVSGANNPAQVYIRFQGNYSAQADTIHKDFYIKARTLSADFTVKLLAQDTSLYYYDSETGYYYTQNPNYDGGLTVLPIVEVSYKPSIAADEIPLVEGDDYRIVKDETYDYRFPGVQRISIVGAKNYTGELPVDYLITADLADANVDVPDQDYTGAEVKPNPTVYFGNETTLADGTVKYDRLINPSEIKVSYLSDNDYASSGKVVIEPNVKWLSGSTEKEYTVRFREDQFKLVCNPKEYLYTGNPIVPAVKLVNSNNEDVDFDIRDLYYTHSNGSAGDHTSIGTVTVYLDKQVGTHTLHMSDTFVIKTVSMSECTLTVPQWMAYQGEDKPVNPSVKVYGVDGSLLRKDVDYTYTIENPVGPGVARVIVTGMGNYSGSLSKSFDIIPSLVTGISKENLSDSSVKLTWGKVSTASGYQVMLNDGVIHSTSKLEYTAANLSPLTDYTANVRAYIYRNGTYYYGNWATLNFSTGAGKGVASITSTIANTATVTWDAHTGASSMYIYRSVDNKTYSLVAVVPANVGTYSDKKLTSNKTYYYKVKSAIIRNGKLTFSELSDPISVKIK